jgi:hypothetical protein
MIIFINDEVSISLVLTRCHQLSSGNYRWKVRFDTMLNPDISVVVRLDSRIQRLKIITSYPDSTLCVTN